MAPEAEAIRQNDKATDRTAHRQISPGWPLHRFTRGRDLRGGDRRGSRARLDRLRAWAVLPQAEGQAPHEKATAANPNPSASLCAYAPLEAAAHFGPFGCRIQRQRRGTDQQGLAWRSQGGGPGG